MYTFRKEERLCSEKLITELFNNGSSFLVYPYRVVFCSVDLNTSYPVQVVMSVPKRRYKRAHDRNLIRRRMKEIYRLHKQELLYDPLNQKDARLLLSIQYIGKEILDYRTMEKNMLRMLKQLVDVHLQKSAKNN